MNGIVQIASTDLAVEISPLGAEMRSLRTTRGTDLLWNADARWWGAASPLLFPVVGRMPEAGTRIGGRRFAMPMHGIAQNHRFEPIATTADRATWRLVDDDATRSIYPFAFELVVEYAARGPALTVSVAARNTGAAAMPASFGFHPGFPWPMPGLGTKDDYRLRFAEEEGGHVWRATGGFVLPDPVASPIQGRDLVLREADFATGTFIFRNLRSRSVEYRHRQRRLLAVEFDGCPNLALWMRPGGDFICIEPWNGLPQAADFDGDLADRPGMTNLEPGQSINMSMRIVVDDALLV